MSEPALDFLVKRDDLRQCKFVSAPGPDEVELDPRQALLAVERFAFTANNITYAVFGDAMQYWSFFPAPEGWGRIPVWGFAQVVRSGGDLKEGERAFGYLPMSTYLVVQPDRVTDVGFLDGSPHRANLPGAYQQYSRLPVDASNDSTHEDHQALLQPLFMTSFLIEDFLADGDLFGAECVLIASASSKTALGVAFLLSRSRPSGCKVVGLTSPGNTAFCEEVGYYDDVVPYGNLESQPPDAPTVYVDMSGDTNVLGAVHRHFGDNLKYSCLVGATHWQERELPGDLPGPDPQFFFAPTQLEKRREDWGPDEFGKRYGEARDAFLPSVDAWMHVTLGKGPEAVESTYRDMLGGKVDPKVGHMLSLHV